MSKQQLPKKSSIPPKKKKTAVRAKSAKQSDEQKKKAPIRAKRAKQPDSTKRKAGSRARSAKQADIAPNVDAHSFCLKDKNGNNRAVLGLDSEGRPGLVFFDPRGQRRLALGMTNDGSWGLWLDDATGKLSGFLFTRADGSPFLGIRSALGTSFLVSLGSDGFDAISLSNESTGSGVLALDRDANAALLRLQTKDRAAIIDLSTSHEVGGQLRISRRAMGVLLGADVTATGIAVVDATGGHRWPETPQDDAGIPRDGQSGQHVPPTATLPPATSEVGVPAEQKKSQGPSRETATDKEKVDGPIELVAPVPEGRRSRRKARQ